MAELLPFHRDVDVRAGRHAPHQHAHRDQGPASAAFYDLDGTLCASNVVHPYARMIARSKGIREKAWKSLRLGAAIPLFLGTNAYSRELFNRIFFRLYAGESEERMRLLAKEVFEQAVRPSLYGQAIALIEQSRRVGHRQVLVTGALDEVAQAVVAHLGMDAYIANRLEFVAGRATGCVIEPLVVGANKARWMQQYAADEGIDLASSYAYSDSFSDCPMLQVVGRPAVVNPDRALSGFAQQRGWPQLHLR